MGCQHTTPIKWVVLRLRAFICGYFIREFVTIERTEGTS
jgi:hypothetical protein